MNLLLLGAGGREHALASSLAKSDLVSKIYWAPGNASVKLDKITSVGNLTDLIPWAIDHDINLVVPGSEDYLIKGINEKFKKVGIPVFGPSQKAARMEGSKAFSKEFMQKVGIPTASFKTFSDHEKAREFLMQNKHLKWVIKASGLAAGKGVILPETLDEGLLAIQEMMVDMKFGDSGMEVVIEERLEGQEVSLLAFTDGYTIIPFPAAQDHKRALDGDQGLNTGGMGAYAPAPIYTPEIASIVTKTILQPTVNGMRKSGFPFVGLLYTGLMLTESGPKVLEYNVRFGDPETQVLLPLLDSDLAEIMLACVEHRLDSVSVNFKNQFAATVVLASAGYPGSYEKGKAISFPAESINDANTHSARTSISLSGGIIYDSFPSNQGKLISFPSGFFDDATIYFAGTSVAPNGDIVTSGGRVMAVTGLGKSLSDALRKSYSLVKKIYFDGRHYRKDIGHRALSLNKTPIGLTYKDAGVSIDSGNLLVDMIKPLVKATNRVGADAEIGGFGGIFDLKEIMRYIPDPVLVSGTDGVGTKLTVAQHVRKHDTIGIDLVAMSVNDVLVQGAEPLFFLDYFASSKLEVDVAKDVVAGICTGCIESNCALIGGETAEMPGIYRPGDYDLAGFVVGIVDRSSILPRMDLMIPGDIVLGLPSSGVHSNGYSLVRHLVSLHYSNAYNAPCPFKTLTPGQTLGEALLTPTRIYVKSLLPIIRKGLLKGMSHITGGGFTENIPRILPDHLSVKLDAKNWPLLPVFQWLKSTGGIENEELARTFNCGIGMVLIASKESAPTIIELLKSEGETIFTLGQVVSSMQVPKRVQIDQLECWSV